MVHNGLPLRTRVLLVTLLLIIADGPSHRLAAQSNGPTMLHPNLAVRTVVTGLETPTTFAFLGPNDILVLEKNNGQVKRIVDGAVQSIVLDLAVNFASERGLLGITLHPDFPINPGVYLYWTESSTGNDTGLLSETPLLGNRVDRFVWARKSSPRKIGVDDPRLKDRVADNLGKHDITESESLLIGRDFGTVTDIETGPNGNLFVVSLTQGAIYEIFQERGRARTSELAAINDGDSTLDPSVQRSTGTLLRNYPNPFNPAATITFDLPEEIHVVLKVYDVMGREVRILIDEVRQPGMNEVQFEASNLPSGWYLYRLETDGETHTGKMLLLK